MGQPEVKKRKTYRLKLTKFELIHLRDLLSITLPPALEQTVSQALAVAEDRPLIEARLWSKVARACSDAELPLDDAAPDFVCAAAAAPPVGVFRLAQEPSDTEEKGEDTTVFDNLPNKDDE